MHYIFFVSISHLNLTYIRFQYRPFSTAEVDTQYQNLVVPSFVLLFCCCCFFLFSFAVNPHDTINC